MIKQRMCGNWKKTVIKYNKTDNNKQFERGRKGKYENIRLYKEDISGDGSFSRRYASKTDLVKDNSGGRILQFVGH